MQKLLSLIAIFAVSSIAPIGTAAILGTVDNLEIEVKIQSPSAQETPLQIICLFEYQEGDIFTSPPALPKELNGLVHVDEALHGLLTNLRKSQQFHGKALETLLITPATKSIPAQQLLLIGLGNRDNFKPEMMRMIGIVGMREALRLGVSSYSHASDLKDAGYSSPTADVAEYVIQGAVEAYLTQKALQKSPLKVTKVTLLSGPDFYESSKEGIKKALKLGFVQFLDKDSREKQTSA